MSYVTQFNRRLFDDVNTFARDTSWLHGPMTAYAKYGVVLFGLLLAIGVISSRYRTARTLAASVWACAAVLVAVAVNQPIVHAAHEARPYTGHPNVLVLVARSADLSFPSDHSVMAGAAAAGLLIVSRRLGLVMLVAAVSMAFARVYVGAHYPGDVLVGLFVGAVVGAFGWLLIRRPLTHAAEWLRTRTRLRTVLVSETAAPAVAKQQRKNARL